MTSSLHGAPGPHGRWLWGCGVGAIALVSSFLLPLAATAVPIQSLATANVPAAAQGGAPSGTDGPRRPGVTAPTSLSRATGSDAQLHAGPRRPVPVSVQNEALAAEK